MLSEATVTRLSALEYRADAKRQVCFLPLGSIYWEDEMPDLRQLVELSEDDRNRIYMLFGVRFKIWDGETLSEDDQRFWDTARSQVPDWALFRRLRLSADDRRAREEAERAAEAGLEALFADADQVTISHDQHGIQSFSATFDLTKERPAR